MEIRKKEFEGLELNIIPLAARYSYLNNQPTHITKGSLSCIDLILYQTVIRNFVNSCGVEISIFEKCHHNIVYGKIYFKIPIPPPYMSEVWDYKNASTESIQHSVTSTDWDFSGKIYQQKG